MPILISRALPADSLDLAKLSALALPPGWPDADIAASCGNARRCVLKAADGPHLSGFAILQLAGGEAEILALAVSAEAQRKGVASAILDNALAICAEKSVSYIFLEVAESNVPAQRLYEKFGFSTIARRENYYSAARPAPETALIMRLDMARGLSQIEPKEGRTS